jgi:GNAT superfamily N-acetyltransferase
VDRNGEIRRVSAAVPAELTRVRGAELRPHLDALAALRIQVFREWPYLYDGDEVYEREYLQRYLASPDSVCVLAAARGELVGAATGMPLSHEGAGFRQPFVERGIAPEQVFYFGESVLLRPWRGQGIGQAFFDQREAFARALGYRMTAFAAVDRAPDDPRRPAGYRGNDALWGKRGYQRQAGMTMRLGWKEIGEERESEKPLTFWLRAAAA